MEKLQQDHHQTLEKQQKQTKDLQSRLQQVLEKHEAAMRAKNDKILTAENTVKLKEEQILEQAKTIRRKEEMITELNKELKEAQKKLTDALEWLIPEAQKAHEEARIQSTCVK